MKGVFTVVSSLEFFLLLTFVVGLGLPGLSLPASPFFFLCPISFYLCADWLKQRNPLYESVILTERRQSFSRVLEKMDAFSAVSSLPQ